jgi:hypothetical protein
MVTGISRQIDQCENIFQGRPIFRFNSGSIGKSGMDKIVQILNYTPACVLLKLAGGQKTFSEFTRERKAGIT